MSIEEYEVIIVGAGPSGLSAGIFVARQRTKCLLISKDLGGQMNMIPKLENYPGTMMSSGPLLAKTLENQYLTFNGEMTFDTVEKGRSSRRRYRPEGKNRTVRISHKSTNSCPWESSK